LAYTALLVADGPMKNPAIFTCFLILVAGWFGWHGVTTINLVMIANASGYRALFF